MLKAAILAALLHGPVHHEDRGEGARALKLEQYDVIAAAISSAARTDVEAALLVAIGRHESRYSLRIHAGRCKPRECDRGRARGPWQTHRLWLSPEAWARLLGSSPESTRAAADHASDVVRRMWNACRGARNRYRATLTAYLGRGCRDDFGPAEERLASFHSALRTIRRETARARAAEAAG